MNDLQIAQLSGLIWQGGAPREDLVARVASAMRSKILAGDIANGTKLPSEAKLAALLAISRPTLREAARVLAREGLLDIRHGVGTFVANRRHAVVSPLDTMLSMSALIRAVGGEPRSRAVDVALVEAPPDVATALALTEGTAVARVTRVRLIGERPLALAYEYVPLRDEAAELATLERFDGASLYEFLCTRLGRSLMHSQMATTAVVASEAQARLLEVKRRSPLLMMREVHFDQDGRRVLYSINYHNSAVVEFTLLRTGMRT